MTNATQPVQQFHPRANSGQVRVASGLQFLLAIYLIISVAVAAFNGGDRWNGIIFGIIVAILSASRFNGSSGPWASWLNALIGVWLIISPWVYGYAGTGFEWNTIIVGIIMIILGVWSAIATQSAETPTRV